MKFLKKITKEVKTLKKTIDSGTENGGKTFVNDEKKLAVNDGENKQNPDYETKRLKIKIIGSGSTDETIKVSLTKGVTLRDLLSGLQLPYARGRYTLFSPLLKEGIKDEKTNIFDLVKPDEELMLIPL